MAGSVYSEAQAVLVSVLTSARRDAGLLQADLGKLLGKDQSYISNIERGQRRVDVLEFYAIARAMQADPVELYTRLVKRLPKRIQV